MENLISIIRWFIGALYALVVVIPIGLIFIILCVTCGENSKVGMFCCESMKKIIDLGYWIKG